MTQSQKNPPSLTLVGCGALGGALLDGWLKTPDLFSDITIITPAKHHIERFINDYPNVTWHEPPPNSSDITMGEVLIFAVKPQIMSAVIQDYAPLVTDKTLVISVAAGIDLPFYQHALGDNKQIVRVMPNTPATTLKAMSGLLANANVTPEHKAFTETLMTAVGKCIWVDNDEQIEKLAAISACGPAYVFALVEALDTAAQNLGFSPEDASLLARETVIGSAHYLDQSPKKTATDLRIQVTSPGGMTQAGLDILLMDDHLSTLMTDVTQAAFTRTKSLKT